LSGFSFFILMVPKGGLESHGFPHHHFIVMGIHRPEVDMADANMYGTL
jgi:hypothetical protein